MTTLSTTPDWQIGAVGDPGLQRWLRQKVRNYLFISQARIEADDLVQDLSLHLLESLADFQNSEKSWIHFCRSLVGRKLRQLDRPWLAKIPQAALEQQGAEQPDSDRKGPINAEPRLEPSLRVSRLLAIFTIEQVAELTGIPQKTLRSQIPGLRRAMERRYPERYPSANKSMGYTGMIRWEPAGTAAQMLAEDQGEQQTSAGQISQIKPEVPPGPSEPPCSLRSSEQGGSLRSSEQGCSLRSSEQGVSLRSSEQGCSLRSSKQGGSLRSSEQGVSLSSKQQNPNAAAEPSQRPKRLAKPTTKPTKTRKRAVPQALQKRLEKKRAQRRLARATPHPESPSQRLSQVCGPKPRAPLPSQVTQVKQANAKNRPKKP